ncbi:Uncharacterised protein [Yersinia frederiksenii]|nr:Uncharacterised protein [Yersinia frederiksenii]CNL77335.1 Uncharacterised protein [Yersinia frederiksenii]CQJ00031.1 Uncharacterised protein [Yersinia frederiksenii]
MTYLKAWVSDTSQAGNPVLMSLIVGIGLPMLLHAIFAKQLNDFCDYPHVTRQ